MENYIELTVKTSHEGSELVSDILYEYAEAGVFVSDVQDVLDLEKSGKAWDYVDEQVFNSYAGVLVKAFFPKEKSKQIIKNIERELLSLKERSCFDLGSL